MTSLPPNFIPKVTCWVEGKQVRWNEDMPEPKGLIPGALWITGDRFYYVDQEGVTRTILGETDGA